MSVEDQKYNEIRESEGVSIKEIVIKSKNWVNFLISKWALILAAVFIGGVFGFIYANVKDPIYKATTTFVLEESGSGNALGNFGGLASMVGIDVGGGGGIFTGDNILELYKSRLMIEKTLLSKVNIQGKKILLLDYYIALNNLRDSWRDKPDLKNIKFTEATSYMEPESTTSAQRLKDSVIGIIYNEIKNGSLNVVKQDNKLSIIKVEVKSKDEFFAKAFNEQVVKTVNDFYVQTKTKKSLDNIAILQKKTDSIRSGINSSIYTAAAVVDATPNLNPTKQMQRAVPMQRSQVNTETNKAILEELIKNLELSKMSFLREKPLIQVIDQPILPIEKEKLGKLKGAVLGSFVLALLVVLVLTIKRMLANLTN